MLCDKAPLKCLWLAQRCVQDDLQPHGHAFSSWSSCCADECKTENGQIGLVNLGLQCIAVLNNDNVGEHCFLSATFTVTAVMLSQMPTRVAATPSAVSEKMPMSMCSQTMSAPALQWWAASCCGARSPEVRLRKSSVQHLGLLCVGFA